MLRYMFIVKIYIHVRCYFPTTGVISNDEFQEINEEEDTFDKARALLHILGSKSSSPNSLLLIGAYLRTVSRSGSQRTLDKRNSFRKMGKHSSIYEGIFSTQICIHNFKIHCLKNRFN